MSTILSVATAGLLIDQLKDTEHLQFPRVDYIELEERLKTDTIDYSSYDRSSAGRLFRRMETQLRSDIYLATVSWLKSRRYKAIFTWSERAGIPFAVYRRFERPNNRFFAMFHCWSNRQEATITRLGLFSVMDQIIVHCSSMKRNLVNLGAMEEKVEIIRYSIDQNYYSPLAGITPGKNLIVSVGETRSRDYAALCKAVNGLSVNVEIAGYGHWYAREKNGHLQEPIPNNVSLSRHLSQFELRDLYARSQIVVLPIHDLMYSAGATAALEAGSMARAVIAFRSRGIVDYVIDGETGILVEPGNIAALRGAIQFLLANPKEAERLGQNARQRILEQFTLESYVSKIADVINQ